MSDFVIHIKIRGVSEMTFLSWGCEMTFRTNAKCIARPLYGPRKVISRPSDKKIVYASTAAI